MPNTVMANVIMLNAGGHLGNDSNWVTARSVYCTGPSVAVIGRKANIVALVD
jgi:hypothetical protein